jgi:hypothetical protein
MFLGEIEPADKNGHNHLIQTVEMFYSAHYERTQ